MGKEMYKFTKAKVLKAIDGSRGSVTKVSKALGCSWHIGKAWIDKFEETKQAFQNEIEKNIDKAENVIYKKIDEDDLMAAKWYLGTIGKKRGYVEKHEVDNNLNIKEFPKLAEKLRKIVDAE